jgi:hypothetical protein
LGVEGAEGVDGVAVEASAALAGCGVRVASAAGEAVATSVAEAGGVADDALEAADDAVARVTGDAVT